MAKVAVVPAQVQPHQQEVVRVDLEQVLAVLAYQHQSECGSVDGEAEEAVGRRQLLSLSRRRVSTRAVSAILARDLGFNSIQS